MWRKTSEFSATVILNTIEINSNRNTTIWINARNNLPGSASQFTKVFVVLALTRAPPEGESVNPTVMS
jgi:hypothetical protein